MTITGKTAFQSQAAGSPIPEAQPMVYGEMVDLLGWPYVFG